jgi:release factor glutamine methyltransferase
MNDFPLQLKHFFAQHQKELSLLHAGLTPQNFLELSEKEIEPRRWDEITSRLLQGEPLHYIIGKRFFFKDEFFVNPSVLIPRFETEILVEKAIKWINQNDQSPLSIVDVGTGSGNILLSLAMNAKNPHHYTGIEISSKALDVAKKNLFFHQYKISSLTKIDWKLGDRLNSVGDQRFDLIVSNPPYIMEKRDRSLVHQQVKNYEPHQALFLADADYENWYNQFFSQIELGLKKGGHCLMEGSEEHLLRLKELAFEFDFCDMEIIKDYNHQDRFLTFFKN